LNKEEKQKLWSLVQEIRAELEPVIDHLLDVGPLSPYNNSSTNMVWNDLQDTATQLTYYVCPRCGAILTWKPSRTAPCPYCGDP